MKHVKAKVSNHAGLVLMADLSSVNSSLYIQSYIDT